MVEPDHRMSDAGQQPLHEGRGRPAAHRVVGEGGRDGENERQAGENDAGRHGRVSLHKRISEGGAYISLPALSMTRTPLSAPLGSLPSNGRSQLVARGGRCYTAPP